LQAYSKIRKSVTNFRGKAASHTRPAYHKRSFIKVTAVLAIAAVAIAVSWFLWNPSRSPVELKQQQLTANSPENPLVDGALSPDGKYLAYADVSGIHLKLVASGETRKLPLPE